MIASSDLVNPVMCFIFGWAMKHISANRKIKKLITDINNALEDDKFSPEETNQVISDIIAFKKK